MEFKPAGCLIDICVLTAVSREGGVKEGPAGAYREQLLSEIIRVADIQERDLDEALVRLGAQGFLESYEWPADGKYRRFFSLTMLGECLLRHGIAQWEDYVRRVDAFLHSGAPETPSGFRSVESPV